MKVQRSKIRTFLARFGGSLVALVVSGIVAALGSMAQATPVSAQGFTRGTTVKAVGFYEGKGSDERLVAVVLYAAGDVKGPKLRSGPRITMRPLGTGKLEQFDKTIQGMKRKELMDRGQLQAAVYFLNTRDGDYASIVSYLIGGDQIVVDDPVNLKPLESGGGSDGGGGGGGGGSGGPH